MHVCFTDDRAIITMKSYLAESSLDIVNEASTPARKNLFKVDPESPPLHKKGAEIFHSVVAKLLYVATRVRMGIPLSVGFLCSRVSKTTAEDEAKRKRLLEYVKGTLDLEYVIGANDLSVMRTLVDASYAVQPNMKRHTGGATSFGSGALLAMSTKQKQNKKISTEAELVVASDYLPSGVWTKLFMEAQGHVISECLLSRIRKALSSWK
jgi:hypothetical protein